MPFTRGPGIPSFDNLTIHYTVTSRHLTVEKHFVIVFLHDSFCSSVAYLRFLKMSETSLQLSEIIKLCPNRCSEDYLLFHNFLDLALGLLLRVCTDSDRLIKAQEGSSGVFFDNRH